MPDELSNLHSRLAGETMRANQGWERYEAANRRALASDKQVEALNVEALKNQARLFELEAEVNRLKNLLEIKSTEASQ